MKAHPDNTYQGVTPTTTTKASTESPSVPLQTADDATTTTKPSHSFQNGCRRSLHRQKVSSSQAAHLSVAVTQADIDEDEAVPVYEAHGDEPDAEQEDFGSAIRVRNEQPPGARAGSRMARMCRCSLEDLDAEDDFRQEVFGTPKPGHTRTPPEYVKHTEPDELLALERLFGGDRLALLGFLTRYGQNAWMQQQDNYLQKAAIATAHGLMGMWRSRSQYVDYPGQWCHLAVDDFEVMDFLNCGWSRKRKDGSRFFSQCKQPEYCPSCNYQLRVKPARQEFLGAFRSAPLWYGLTVMATSDPAKAGVKMFVGYDEDNQPIYEPLVMFSELVNRPRLSKYDSQCCVPYMVAAGLWSLMLWLVAGHYFDGLHVAGENDFTYYPDTFSPVGVSHTVNPHFHAYGNTERPVDRRRALFILKAAVTLMHREGGGRLWAYPDIALRPVPSPEALQKTINYVFKPWNFAKTYIDGLAKGCPLTGLNLEFHTTYFGSEHLLYRFPSSSGLSTWGAKLGNLSEKAGDHYIGNPLPRILTAQQVKRFQERLARDEIAPWEVVRYSKHLELQARLDRRRHRQQAEEMEAHLVNAPVE